MQSVTRLPRLVIVLEVAGGLLMTGALLLVNHWLPVPDPADVKTVATALFMTGGALMLPAVGLLLWRSVKAIASQRGSQINRKK